MTDGLLGRRGRGTAERAALDRSAARITPLALYPEPLDTARVRILHVPWLMAHPTAQNRRRPLSYAASHLMSHRLPHDWFAARSEATCLPSLTCQKWQQCQKWH